MPQFTINEFDVDSRIRNKHKIVVNYERIQGPPLCMYAYTSVTMKAHATTRGPLYTSENINTHVKPPTDSNNL